MKRGGKRGKFSDDPIIFGYLIKNTY